MNLNGRLIKVAAPVAAAVAIGAVAFASSGMQSNGNDIRSQQPAASAEGAGRAPKELIGNEDNPATWRLPVEDYIPLRAEVRTVSNVRDQLIDDCMSKAGYEDWQPAPDLPDLSGTSLVDRRYGVHDPALTSQRGYHPSLAVQNAYDAALEIGAVDKSGSDPGALRACVEATDAKAPDVRSDPLVQQIDSTSYVDSMKDPAVVAAFGKWSSCMKEKGYSYKNPLEPMEDPRFGHPTTVTEAEIATARADLDCRGQFDVTRTWFDTESKIQQEQIKRNASALRAIAKDNRSVIAKSAKIAAKN
ncbi:hypothetical protein ABT389_29675 [Streptomyces bacillaris]|uniref:hypothetical protein n=1 Tax=Streptomyces bacillaris TaxID=68179 RepID=UPI00335CDE46